MGIYTSNNADCVYLCWSFSTEFAKSVAINLADVDPHVLGYARTQVLHSQIVIQEKIAQIPATCTTHWCRCCCVFLLVPVYLHVHMYVRAWLLSPHSAEQSCDKGEFLEPVVSEVA